MNVPPELPNAQAFSTLRSRLPSRPYCADELPGAVRVRPRDLAITKPHLQINGPSVVGYLLFDIDRADSSGCWIDADLPAPLWEAANRKNGHRHLGYELEIPVRLSGPAARFAVGLSEAMVRRLGADSSYGGLLTKNPLHDEHDVEIVGRPTSLRDLYAVGGFESDDLRRAYRRTEYVSALGRNCAVFDTARGWAYRYVSQAVDGEAWAEAVLQACQRANTFGTPLSENELRQIAKSISKWVWSRKADFSNYRPRRVGIMGFAPLPAVMEAGARIEAVRERQSAGGAYARRSVQTEAVDAIRAARAALGAAGKRPTKAAIASATGLAIRTVERRWKESLTGQMALGLEEEAA